MPSDPLPILSRPLHMPVYALPIPSLSLAYTVLFRAYLVPLPSLSRSVRTPILAYAFPIPFL